MMEAAHDIDTTPATNAGGNAASSAAGSGRYFNRELSWLAFNERVLAEGRNANYPLLERLRFLSISGSNIDEFLMVRVAGLAGQVRGKIEEISIDGQTPAQQLAATHQAVIRLEAVQQEIWSELCTAMAAERITIIGGGPLEPDQANWLEGWFLSHVLPVVTPQAIDPAHPFPFIANQGMGVMMALTRRSDEASMMEMVLIPQALPRFVRLPGEAAVYISIEDLLCRHAELLFPGFKVGGTGVFRVLRDSDLEIEEDAEDLVRHFRSAIQRRRRGSVILLQLQGDFDPAAEQLLREQLQLDHAITIKTAGLIGVSGISVIVDEARPDLKFEPYSPRFPERVMQHDGDCFAAIRDKDMVIHHPYESFEVVVDFLRQAAADPDVIAIKQTLYRAGKQSAVIAALIAARRSRTCCGRRNSNAPGCRSSTASLTGRRMPKCRWWCAARPKATAPIATLAPAITTRSPRASIPIYRSSPPIPSWCAMRARCSTSSPAMSSRAPSPNWRSRRSRCASGFIR
jgi:polyphosphate kinase